MLAFDIAFKKKDDDDSRREMWSIISALGMWVNMADLGAYYGMRTITCTSILKLIKF